MKPKITKLMICLGFRPSYKGFPYLAHVIMLASEQSVPVTMTELYSQTARAFNVPQSKVQHDIRTIIKVFWNTGHIKKFEEILGYPLCEKLPVKEFVYTIAEYINRS